MAPASDQIFRRLLQAGLTTSGNRDVDGALAAVKEIGDPAFVADFLTSTQMCWKRIQKARNATLCYVCSKDNPRYFFAGKAIVSQDDCNSILGSCLRFFSLSVKVIAAAKRFTEELRPCTRETPDCDQPKRDSFKAYVERTNDGLLKANIPGLITDYSAQVRLLSKQAVGNQICARIIRLHQQPLFINLDVMLSIINYEVGKLTGSATPADIPGPEVYAALAGSVQKGKRRILDGEGEFNPFMGDVSILQQQDNLFVSFDGVQGSSQGVGSTAYTPMNLSTWFP